MKAGELLVTIDPAPYAAEVDRAQAQAVAAQARLDLARSEHDRAQRLWNESAIARRELDERVNARQEAEANLRAAEAALQSARLNLGYTQVRAPVAGRVGRLEVTVDDERRILDPGDAYYFESRRPHRFRCVGGKPCEVISACTPPTF